jgi:FkbM family methyltransferase
MKSLLRFHRITHTFDVGANTGQFAQKMRREFGFSGLIDSFEPISMNFSALKVRSQGDNAWRCHHYGLGDADSEVLINVSENSVSSSILPIEALSLRIAPETRYVGSEQIAVRRLDSVFDGLAQTDASIFLKADVQGYEGRLIQGAKSSLPFISLVQLEVATKNLYRGEASLVEIVEAMLDSSFDLIGAEPAFVDRKSAHVLQMDLLFANRLLAAMS